MTAAPRPHVYQAINQIIRAFSKSGIAKRHTNAFDQYQYRSVDDILGRLGPLLARSGLCILPRALRRESEDRAGDSGTLLVSVRLLVAFDLVSTRDGSRHVIKAWGEALDQGDKGTAKAMSAAYKSAMLQTFCVPVTGGDDADARSPRLRKHVIGKEPVQGWQAWSADIMEMIGCCETAEALDCMRSRQAALLTAVSRERADLYAGLGSAFSSRMLELARHSQTAVKGHGIRTPEGAPVKPTETVDG